MSFKMDSKALKKLLVINANKTNSELELELKLPYDVTQIGLCWKKQKFSN